ncbi:LOW QUALITY PROTEIN: uncharacterized protein EMH_0049790 [Eimeria mitis]|uniref:Uncharacterized protein n=1 Tax=Eimeria mitis TaxID=44415 RepID=U6JVG3_9EIME|nr:LOW QUALITY PROTEIN: uncharacterized protein EMH_0049790 [Eimeria mitis]CDJ29455.1 hypothetical protein, conserved [Eimeria mitis]
MARKSFRVSSRAAPAGDWITEMMRAIVGDNGLDALGVSTEDAGKAVCKNVFPVVRKHIAFIIEYNNAYFEAALVDEITQGEGPIASMELLEKVKEASQRIKELTALVESQTEKMRELEASLAQANEFLDKVENVKEDALAAAEKSREFAKKEEEKFPKTSKEFIERLRLEVRDEVALELAEQATAATAASNVETAEKEIQTDPVALDSPHDSVPLAPDSEASSGNQPLTSGDRDLLHSCLAEVRRLAILSNQGAGGSNLDVSVNRQGVSLRNSCVGTSEGIRGGHQGNVYEHVPLTTLRLSPICRAPPERSELESTRSILLSAPLSPPGRLSLEQHSDDYRNARGVDFGCICPASEAAFAAAAASAGSSNRPPAAVETATLQETPQMQTFVHSHMVSAELPDEVSVHPTPEFSPLGPCSPAEGSTASLALSRETSASALRTRKSPAAKAQGKLQISFADEPLFTSDPPGSSSASSTVFNLTENAQQEIASPQELPTTNQAPALHSNATSPLPPEPNAVAAEVNAAAAAAAPAPAPSPPPPVAAAVLNIPQNDTSSVGTTTEGTVWENLHNIRCIQTHTESCSVTPQNMCLAG